MSIIDLPEEEQTRIYWVLDWISRMTRRYGGTVHDINGKTWDWGQALCRECYGENWSNSPELPETPTRHDIVRAKECETTLWDWILEPCSVCHGNGATTNHNDPCDECNGNGYYERGKEHED